MISNRLGSDVRRALREKITLGLKLKTVVVFMNECHEKDSGRFCETHGQVHGGSASVEDEDPFGVSRPAKNRSRLGKLVEGVPGVTTEELTELRSVRSKEVTKPRLNFKEFPGELGPIRGQVNVDKAEVWLTREEFLNRRDGRGMSALERYSRPDLHGLIVEQNGRYLDPFSSSHAVVRLHQTGMPKLINRVIPKVTGEEALAVELKPSRVSGGSRDARQKNRLYMVAGEKAGKRVALNVVILPNGEVKTAFLEFSDGSYANPLSVRKALEREGVKIPNKLIKVGDFK